MSLSNQSIVINDLLSFFSCKINSANRRQLVRSIKEYYSDEVILKAQKILLDSVPVKKSTRHGRRLKHPDPVETMYECFQLIASEDLPIFVCRNLNNVPHLDSSKENFKEEMLDERELTIEEEYENSHQDIKDEQIAMKSQIADITDVVKQIKDQLKHIVQQQPSPSKFNNISVNGAKRRKSIRGPIYPNKKNKAMQLDPSIRLKKKPKTPMAYMQKLIDEEADVKSEPIYEDSQKDGYSDYLDEISEDEEKFVQSACEVILQENLEGFDQINMLKGTPLKMPGEKIIYIKNEEEDFEFDNYSELQIDDENSIEISSADHFSSFDEIDSSNKGGIKACGKVQEGEIKTHTINEDDLVDLICADCGIKFLSYKLLDEHICKKHVYKCLFECVLCGLKFRSKDLLRQHYAKCVENTIEKYGLSNRRCPVPSCGRMHAEERALKQHMCMHSESRQYVCVKCEYRYLTETALNLHVKSQHNPLNKYNCPFCISSYFNFTGLKNHIRCHTGERPYECKECDYKASTPDLLKRHMLKHRPPQLYSCDICNQEFLGNAKLSRHKVKEHKKENIICRLCSPPKVFNNSCVYNRHYRTHTGERQFECSLCNYAGSSKEVLLTHQKTHMGANRNCPQCNVPILTSYSLKRHLKLFCKSNLVTYEYVY